MKEWLGGILGKFFYFLYDIISAGIPNKNISVGLTIILFTIVIRILLLPLSIKQTKASVKMSEIQPKAKALQDKYKNDPQRAQQELMKLYKEEGVSPMGGCLPMLIQFPILIALFYVFSTLDYQGASFLWVPNLSKPDPYYILPILSTITTYLSSKFMQPGGDSEVAKKTSSMNIGMAIFFGFMSLKFQAALVLYWVVNNLIQLVQTLALRPKDKKKVVQ
ncbi:MAG: membrane protein insertase YidC [Clostridium argentinense]|uniref:membrane protein insertase YidC n=1 Tax=Clostridium butanoliproducens TaxID=2991837 RepID=UPI001D668BFB|nr:membrane protein insertase YidC [Clostridium butanoliproducens]MBS5823725.1 membrane protein insertase YidC [Clostridium argentinense]MDU1350523.1 membrane protein insertase YidC [Clostridium argentinense]